MKTPDHFNEPEDLHVERIRDQAIAWIVRRDRGLSAQETKEFFEWRSADPRNSAAIDRSSWAWGKLQVPGRERRERVFTDITRVPWAVGAISGMAAAGVIFLGIWSQRPALPDGPPKTEFVAATFPVTTRVLSDGSTVRLPKGSEITTSFSPQERRVTVSRGDAYFEVTKDARRPFVVVAGQVHVHAVGTAFAVRMKPGDVDVLVTEGIVAIQAEIELAVSGVTKGGTTSLVTAGGVTPTIVRPPTTVIAGQRASVRIAAGEEPQTVVIPLNASELNGLLQGQESLIEFDGATLRMIADQFERRTGAKIDFSDITVGETRLGGSFPPHDLEGFLALLGENYGIKATRGADGSIVLGRAL
jgi:transmembrane sensor